MNEEPEVLEAPYDPFQELAYAVLKRAQDDATCKHPCHRLGRGQPTRDEMSTSYLFISERRGNFDFWCCHLNIHPQFVQPHLLKKIEEINSGNDPDRRRENRYHRFPKREAANG